jgi:ketosteroid isomerase-like protein
MARLEDWVAGYQRAWESNDPVEIRNLFSEDAVYRTEPGAAGWHGRDQIVKEWLARHDEPGDATFEWEPLIETGEIAVITGHTSYRSGEEYDNLWVIRFDGGGRCDMFTEWWMQEPART